MESTELLSIEDQLAGYVEPDLSSFSLQGADDVWLNTESNFVLTASPKEKVRFQNPYLGGRWGVKISYGMDGSPISAVNVTRSGQDCAFFSYKFLLEGVYKIYVDVSSIPVSSSPFTVLVRTGSENQLDKWSKMHQFLSQDFPATSQASVNAFYALYIEAAKEHKVEALDYRRHLLGMLDNTPGIPNASDLSKEIRKCVVLRKQGSIVYDSSSLQALLVCHNSWMEWPKETGYQAKILNSLQEKEAKLLLEKSSSFGKNKLSYGSTVIFPVSNLAIPEVKVNPKQLINTVTVVFKSKDKLASQPFKHTKPEDLKTALDLAFREADFKGIKSIGIPHTISQKYFSGGKNEETVFNIVKELASTKAYKNIEALVIFSKNQTPKPTRKKIVFGLKNKK